MPDKRKDTERMRQVAKAVDDRLPDGFGFIVMAFPFEGIQDEPRLSYVSNANRSDVIKAVKEWLFTQGEAENWMEHVD